MKNDMTLRFIIGFVLILVSTVAGQDKKADSKPTSNEAPAAEIWFPEEGQGMIEFGGRSYWGDVYGRPDLPFKPNLATSKMNEYTDIPKNFLIRRARISLENVFGTSSYFNYQTQNSFYTNQSHLATFGQWNKFKLQIRYDEIPHIFTNTARTLYVDSAPGVYTLPLIVRQGLQMASSTGTAAQINNTLPSYVATQVVPIEPFFTPQLRRHAGSGLFTYNLRPDWSLSLFFRREHETGTRPIGAILNSSPSASASSQPSAVANRQSPGTGAELPEPIDYNNSNVRLMTEYGKRRWALQVGYDGSFFESNIKSLLFDNPFATADVPVQIIPPGDGCTPAAGAANCAISAIPAHGQMALYPDNQAHYLSFAGAFDAAKRLRIMGTAANGWLRQDDAFLPYTANTALTGLAPLPAGNLQGEKHTLAMNWTAVSKMSKNLELEAKYRHYDYINNTRVFSLTPVEGDVMGADSTATGQAAPAAVSTIGRSNPGFKHKTLELTGNYLFSTRSSVEFGWDGDWYDRSYRDAERSFEHTLFGSVDLSPNRDLLFRISGRHQDRRPHEYQDENSSDPVTGAPITCTSTSIVFTTDQRCNRRFDEAARILNRADALIEYDLGPLSFSGTFQTIQSDYNQRAGTNSPVPLNFIAGTTHPYYLYGALNDLSWIYTFEANYNFSPSFSAFAEYSRELYHKRMISRNRTPASRTQTIQTCTGCDTANNDWESVTRDIFDTYAIGLDIFAGKRLWCSPYYSLAAGKGNVFSRALGDPTITTGANAFLLTGTSTPESYPETTTRIHELAVVLKYKITNNVTPKFEYRYQQFDNRDYQTTPMVPYLGCIGAGAVVVSPPCVNVGANLAAKYPSLNYPGFVVGDTAAARYLFLGADQPSYRTHIITATLEFRF